MYMSQMKTEKERKIEKKNIKHEAINSATKILSKSSERGEKT